VPGAHIVLLAPFLDVEAVDEGVVTELREFFAELTPFAYVLTDAAEFPGGQRYLPPQPVGVFRRITHSLRRTFPEVIGRATSLDTVVPHLSLPDDVEVPTPLEVHAREALLLHGPDPDPRTLATFRFGESAA
jgi:2'-5' RNA ligase superfamily protein